MSKPINPEDMRIEDLDKLEVRDEYNDVVAKIALKVTLYAKNTHTYEKKSALIDCIESYLRLVGNELKLHLFDGSHVKKYDLDQPPDFEIQRQKFTEDTPFGYDATGITNISEASSYSITTGFNADYDRHRAGFISASFPIQFVLAQVPRFLRDLCLDWAERIQAQHGYAGFGLQRSIIFGDANDTDVDVYPLIQRFPGLELDDPLTHSIHCRDKIKGVNWLTVLSNELVDKLDGEAAIEKAFKGTHNRIHHWKGGLALQAGPHPQLGDMEENNIPEAYRQVYRIVKKVQVDYPWDLMETPLDINPTTFSKSWFTRFK